MLEKLKAVSTNPLVIVVAVALAYAAGRTTAPVQVKTVTDKTTTEIHHEQTVVQQNVDIDALLKAVREEFSKYDRSWKKTTVIAPDGTKHIEESSDTHGEAGSKTTVDENVKETSKTTATGTSETTEKTTEKTTVEKTSAKAYTFGWGLTLGSTYDVRGGTILKAPSVVPGIPDQLAVGVYVEQKLPLLPVFLNITANSQGDIIGFLRLPLPTSLR